MDDKSPLERAFELARSGQYTSVRAVKRQLFDEGYSTHQIAKTAVLTQLRKIIQSRLGYSANGPKTDILKR